MLIIDPPAGWMYGFPKPFDIMKEQDLVEWLLANGYPQDLIDKGMAKYCRYWTADGAE